MDAEKNRERIHEITHAIIGCAHAVNRGLGCGFLEKVRENALSHALRKRGMNCLRMNSGEPKVQSERRVLDF